MQNKVYAQTMQIAINPSC